MQSIFFNIQNFEEDAPIINQLVNIVDQVNVGSVESIDKLMDWSARRFETKVVDKVSITITEKKVQLQERVQIMIELIQKVKNLYTIWSNVPRFTNNIQAQITQIQAEMKRFNNIISEST